MDGYDVSLATGTVGWERGVHRAVPTGPKHVKNTYASETPITDGERIYAYFGSVGLFVFDLAGSPIWSKEMAPVKMRSGHGHASSPALFDDRLVIVNDNDTQSFVAAFDEKSGRQLWKVEREEGTNWSTPFIWAHDGAAEVITAGTRGIRSYKS